jgi:hypothetical protein
MRGGKLHHGSFPATELIRRDPKRLSEEGAAARSVLNYEQSRSGEAWRKNFYRMTLPSPQKESRSTGLKMALAAKGQKLSFRIA